MDSDYYTIGLSSLVKEHKPAVVGLFVSQVILAYLLCFGHLNLFLLLAGVSFANKVVIVLMICYAFYLFQERHTKRLKYGFIFFILLGALFATQRRGAMLELHETL